MSEDGIIKGPQDIADAGWLLDLHADFLMDSKLPAPMIAVGRTAIVYLIGCGQSIGIEIKFPLARAEAERAVEHLRELQRRAMEAASLLN